jgi:hypothetical protein
VARVRWHVSPAESAEALGFARALGGDGVPHVSVAAGEPPSWLVVSGPPAAAASTSLDDVLKALAGADWRERAAGTSFPELLARLTGTTSPRDGAARGLLVDAPASFVVLRGAADAAPAPESLRVESVYVDGREANHPPPGPSNRH